MSEACFTAADILLPAAGVPLDPWACIAVDQFTSQPEYWQRAEHLADGKPSTLHIVLPEAYLGTPQEAERLESIRRTMEELEASARLGAQVSFFRLGENPGLARFIDAMAKRVDGRVLAPELDDLGVHNPFPDQASAEAWLTANYLELDSLGIRKVTLYEEDRLVYGPMSLES